MKVTRIKAINPKTIVKVKFDGFLPNQGQHLIYLLEQLEEQAEERNTSCYTALVEAIEKQLGIYKSND